MTQRLHANQGKVEVKRNSRVAERPVGVIGGGLGGLAAACVLAARGHQVTLYERSAWLGGKAAVYEESGYRFDMGPTILTLPSVLRRIFAEADCELDECLELVRLDPQWRSFFADASTLDLFADEDRMATELDRFAPRGGAGAGYRRFLALARRQHEVSNRYFFWKPVGGLIDTFEPGGMFRTSVLADLRSMRLGRSVASTVRSHVADGRVAQMLDHFTQYVGSAPDQSPAILCGIAHMQTSEGVWYPMGGTRAVPNALVALAESLGVEFRLSADVRRIVVEHGQAVGVELADGSSARHSAVVSNSDTVLTHRELLDEATKRRFAARRGYEPACSGVVLYLGLDRAYDHLAHHNFVFSTNPHAEFEAIYRRGEPADDPTCYVCAPARTDPATAPAGGEALYVLVHVPYLRSHHDWREMWPRYRRTVLEKLRRTAGLDDLERRIVLERALTPADIESRYHVPAGAIYGLASHGRFLGAFKPSNRSPDVDGLYFAGGSAHPGPGMPMVLMSGWIAADAVDKDLGGSSRPERSWECSRVP